MTIAEQLEQKGMEKGLQLGRQKGFYEGKLEVAENMLQNGFDRNAIIKMTGLTAQDLAGFEY